jgi:butyryl-CoA dehydrogenase
VVARIEDKMGQHSSDTAQINFDNCRIPAENLLGEEGEGYKIALSRWKAAASASPRSVGMARARFEAALQYAKERESFGTAIFEHQAVGFRLADMRHADRGRAPADLARRQPADAGRPA